MAEIDTYVGRVERALAFDPPLAERVACELTDHLRESAERVGAAEAIVRFGEADSLARHFAARSLATTLRTLAAFGAFGVTAVFAIMELRSTALARAGTTIFASGAGYGAPLFALDAAGFVVAAVAATLVAFWIHRAACRIRLALSGVVTIACGLFLSIVCDATATVIHVRGGGGAAIVATSAALLESAISFSVVFMTGRLIPRAVRAAALVSTNS